MKSESQTVQIFVVDWAAEWTSIDEVSAAQRALAEACRRVTARGGAVRCLQSVFVTAERRWICLISAKDSTTAYLTADTAQIPRRVISTGMDLLNPPMPVSGAEVLSSEVRK